MLENYDVILTGKSWDQLNVNEVMTNGIKEEGLMEIKKIPNIEKKPQNTPEDDICVICFDKKIDMLLKPCLVYRKNKYFYNHFIARIL